MPLQVVERRAEIARVVPVLLDLELGKDPVPLLVLQALAAVKSSPEELAEIRKLLRGAGASDKTDAIDDSKTGGSR